MLQVTLEERSYPVFIGSGLLHQEDLFLPYITGRQVAIVTNETIPKAYLEGLKAIVSGYDVIDIVLPDGERFKNLETANHIFSALLSAQHTRTTTLIALGGGVVGDTTGFAAACYQRGVNFIQVPTTLLSQVDSSVGGKTGVNHKLGKNMIGAFYQPQAVIIDTDTLSTLPNREFNAGLAEVVKYGVIRDINFYYWLESNADALANRDGTVLEEAIYRSCFNKSEVVSADEKELSGYRGILNFGHTFGHAIETSLNYEGWLHGEAVAAGMVMAFKLSQRLGAVSTVQLLEFEVLLQRLNLPIRPPKNITSEEMLQHMAVDKKNVNKVLKLVLLNKLGEAIVTQDFDQNTLMSVLEEYIEMAV